MPSMCCIVYKSHTLNRAHETQSRAHVDDATHPRHFVTSQECAATVRNVGAVAEEKTAPIRRGEKPMWGVSLGGGG